VSNLRNFAAVWRFYSFPLESVRWRRLRESQPPDRGCGSSGRDGRRRSCPRPEACTTRSTHGGYSNGELHILWRNDVQGVVRGFGVDISSKAVSVS